MLTETRKIAQLINPVRTEDMHAIVDLLVLAFSSDPVNRWVYPDAHQFLTHFPHFVRVFGGKAFACGTAYALHYNFGAALWLPPGVTPDEESLITLMQQSADAAIQADLFAVLEQMGHYHPSEPHWYLSILGVDPTQQGKGYGSALLQYQLQQCDRDHQLAYLESSNPKNIPLYEQHGFQVLGIIQAGSFPPIFPMLRYPKSGAQ